MKSAYELAIEKLKANGLLSEKPLSEDQRKGLAEVEALYRSKIAEREIFLKKTLEEILATQGEGVDSEQIRRQIINERERLNEEKERKQNILRDSVL